MAVRCEIYLLQTHSFPEVGKGCGLYYFRAVPSITSGSVANVISWIIAPKAVLLNALLITGIDMGRDYVGLVKIEQLYPPNISRLEI